MIQSEVVTTQTVGLTNYEDEPIHIPGSIQPYGILLVLKEPHLQIVQVSNNTFELLGISTHELLKKQLKDLLDPKQMDFITKCLLSDFEKVNPLKIKIKNQNRTLIFDGIIQRSDGVLLLQLEPANYENVNFFSFHSLVKGPIAGMQNASSLHELCQVIVKEVRKVTCFDRVMVYQFDSEGAGTVIAEDKLESLSPYLGLHYPALDIPGQARQLFTLNLLRLIPDVNYQPVDLIPAHNPVSNRPLDLSYSVLRSVSPCHIEYLNNMGVAASMVISLIRDKKLWGLLVCHHQSAKYVPYEVRTACEFLSQVMSLELASKEENEDLDYKIKLKSIQSQFIEAIPHSENFVSGLVKDKSNLLDLVGAQGVAVCSDEHLTVIGKTPGEADIQNLIEWVESKINNDIFLTDSLPKSCPAAEKFKDVASGLLAVSISKIPKNYILWFRPEVIQTVNWGGNPNKAVEVTFPGSRLGTRGEFPGGSLEGSESTLRLSPRKSFELWQEAVRLKSLPWKQCEIDAALELRSAIVVIVLRKAAELAKINVDLERSNSELDAFAYIASHDLKEPLRGIHNYSSFLIEDYADVLNEDGVSKLQTLVRLTQRMEDLIESLLHFSRLGRVELSLHKTNLNEVVKTVIDILSISSETKVDIRISRPLPKIQCDRIQVSEVFSNLISNAIKYNDKADKWVEIGFLEYEEQNIQEGKERGREEEMAHREHPNNAKTSLVGQAQGLRGYRAGKMPTPQEENSISAKMGCTLAHPPSPIVFYVRDNGIGIREKHLDTIFRIFKRLHGPHKYGGGTGAGLTIAKKIVERHGGKIWVESTYGSGTTFYFTLQS